VRELEKEEWGSERIPAGYDVGYICTRYVMQGGAYVDPLSAIVGYLTSRCSCVVRLC
jgi:hypothetical protein